VDKTLPTNPQGQAYKPATGEELPFETPGRYAEEETEIGRGGIGRVVVRRDVLLGREVAVKELLPEFQPSRGSEAKDIAERFLTEAKVTARLEHPGIVPVYELGRRADGSLYYSMKRVRGRTLEQALDDCASLSDRLTLMQHVLDVVQTLAYAHSHGVIHRDLKPGNVMVGEFGETQVLDWGLARVRGVNDIGPTGERLQVISPNDSLAGLLPIAATMAGQLLGTPAYMSPEQAAGENASVDERSDVWCLGAILFEVLTGRQLFEAQDVKGMLEAVKVAPVRRVRQVEPEAPKGLADVADRALQRDPEKRFSSAVEMAEALEYALRKPTVAGRPVGVALAFAGAFAALVLAVISLINAQRDADTARSFAEDTHATAARNEGALVARLAREELEKRDYARADALARQALSATRAGEGDPLARGVLALLEGAARPVLRWESGTPGCSGVAAERGMVACPTFGAVELRSLDTGELMRSLSTGPTGWQHAAAFMPDGTLLSAGDDRLVHVWDAAGGSELAKWAGHEAPITSLALRGGTVATGALDGEVRIWEATTGSSRVLAKHAGPVRALAFTKNDELASSGPDGFRVWNLEGKNTSTPKVTLDMPASAMARGPKGLFFSVEREVFALTGDDAVPLAGSALDEVTAVATSDVASLIVGDGRGHVRGFDARRSLLWRLSGVDRGVRALAVEAGDSSGRVLVVASRGKPLQAFELPEDPRLWLDAPAAAWGWEEGAPSARAAILLGDRKGKVSNAAGVTLLEGPLTRIRALAGSKGQVIAGGDDGVVRLLGEKGRELARRDGRPVTALAISPDGTRAAFGWDDGTLTIWELALNKEVSTAQGSPTVTLAFSRDGRWVAQGRADRRVALIDPMTGKESANVEVKSVPASVAFAPGGDSLAVGLDRGGQILGLPDLMDLGAFSGPNEPSRTLSYSPDGERLVAGSDDGQAYVWAASSRRLTHVLPVEAGDIPLVRFVDDEHVVIAGADRSVRAVTVAK